MTEFLNALVAHDVSTGAWAVAIAGGSAAFLMAGWFVLVFCQERAVKKAWKAARAASEVPAPNLRHLRIVTGATCFACRKKPAEVDGLWCDDCAKRIHEYDANDTRGIEDK